MFHMADLATAGRRPNWTEPRAYCGERRRHPHVLADLPPRPRWAEIPRRPPLTLSFARKLAADQPGRAATLVFAPAR